ncbi:increased loss of mitochondrial DNA protein 1 [Xylaria venustula]|nr:increased loss of mitochondrial DNA protein 1 [Xylaria venustula]
MALISASTILTSICLFHVTLAYFFYTNPHAIADQALVWVLGEAVGMPQTQSFSTPSPTSSFLAVILFLVGISDLITLSMPEEIWLVHYWGSQAPARIVVFGSLTLFTYLTTPSTTTARLNHFPPAYGTGSGSEGLRNRVFFAFTFFECLSWFWAWVTLREEAIAFAARKRRRSSSSAKERS